MQVDKIIVIRIAIRRRLEAHEGFTAFDISTLLKSQYCQIRHRDVAETVREMFEAGEMATFQFTRQLTEVAVDSTTTVQSFKYERREG